MRSVVLPLALVALAACAGGRNASEPSTVTLPDAAASAQASSSPSVIAEPPPRSNRGSGPDGCFTRDDLAARNAQVQSDRETTRVEALRRLGLAPAKLAGYVLVQAGHELSGPTVAPHVEDRDAGGKRVRVIVMPPTGGCGNLLGSFEFARGGDRVFLVKGRITTRKVEVTACGCPSCACETPSYSGCGGRRIVADTILGYELPPGTDYGGEREVQWVEDWVGVTRELPPQPVCVAPPPPP